MVMAVSIFGDDGCARVHKSYYLVARGGSGDGGDGGESGDGDDVGIGALSPPFGISCHSFVGSKTFSLDATCLVKGKGSGDGGKK
jgi:hypothetical protein